MVFNQYMQMYTVGYLKWWRRRRSRVHKQHCATIYIVRRRWMERQWSFREWVWKQACQATEVRRWCMFVPLFLESVMHVISYYHSCPLPLCRPSLSQSESESDEPPLSHFNCDSEVSVYSQTSTGYTTFELVNILMSTLIPEEKVCKLQPLGVNLDAVNTEDKKADDLGSWRSTGTCTTYFRVNRRNKAEFLQTTPTQAAMGLFVVILHILIHTSYNIVWWCIVNIQG